MEPNQSDEYTGAEWDKEDAYPTELDISRYVEEAVRGGATPFFIANAIWQGFSKVDPFKAEQCADELQSLALDAQKNA
jgi:hypothetical protein